MGKKKDKDKEHDSPGRKKVKKHKKHKKKRDRLNSDDNNEEIDVVNNDDLSQDESGKGLKLKIKFGGRTLSTTEVVPLPVQQDVLEMDVTVDAGGDVKNNRDHLEDSNEMHDDDEDDEEEEDNEKVSPSKSEDEVWLDALEKGELDDTGSVKKEKDISLMTSRQRALHGETIEGENELLQLPMYPEKTEEDNEEFERKRKLRAKKRKQQMEKQIEETKTATVEKLLTKGAKLKKETAKSSKKNGPHFRYTSNASGIFISFTEDLTFPLPQCTVQEPPPPTLCAVDGCNKLKKYACSKTQLPVCSLQCYKTVNM